MTKHQATVSTTTVPPRRSRRRVEVPAPLIDVPSHEAFHEFVQRVATRFTFNCGAGKLPLFNTDAKGLFSAYLDMLPLPDRQHHNCNTCRHFIERFGGLVTISANGEPTPALWNTEDAPPYYFESIRRLYNIVKTAKVTSVFLTDSTMLGPIDEGENSDGRTWHHFGAEVPEVYVCQDWYQQRAKKTHNMENTRNAIEEYPVEHIKKAVALMQVDAVCRGEKFIGPATWLLEVATAYRSTHNPTLRANILWQRTARVPDGFCHVRGGMLGMLLSDIGVIERQRTSYVRGVNWTDERCAMELDKALRAFERRMDPLAYQRPQAPPKEGTIVQANKLVEELGIEPALKRRWMARAELPELVWEPPRLAHVNTPSEREGRFDYLRRQPREKTPEHIKSIQSITWTRFRRDVLSYAERIMFHVHSQIDAYAALVTAVHPEAKPILKWDGAAGTRNPASWYTYATKDGFGGSRTGVLPSKFGLVAGTLVEVTGICRKPHEWYDAPLNGMAQGVIFLLSGAHDTNDPGLALLPEDLNSVLHGVRSVIESASAQESMGTLPEGTEYAAGIAMSQHGEWSGGRFDVTVDGLVKTYQIDRWE